MALKIRLARGGAKKKPFYRIVVAEATAPRDGKFVERVGSYNPLLPQGHQDRIVLNTDRAKYWLSVGAQPTERVARFLGDANLIKPLVLANRPIKAAPGKKAQERLKEEQMNREKAAAAAEAAKVAAAEAAEAAKMAVAAPAPEPEPAAAAEEAPAEA